MSRQESYMVKNKEFPFFVLKLNFDDDESLYYSHTRRSPINDKKIHFGNGSAYSAYHFETKEFSEEVAKKLISYGDDAIWHRWVSVGVKPIMRGQIEIGFESDLRLLVKSKCKIKDYQIILVEKRTNENSNIKQTELVFTVVN